jgi:serine/threonine-protein kinase
MGEVWRAFDTTTNRVVAVKVLNAQLATDAGFEERFRREALAAAALNNPHVIPIHTFGEIDGRLFVDMRLIEGRDLDSVIGKRPLEPTRAVRIVEQAAKALRAAHKVGLIHRDVKPSNILLDEDDYAYLIDFGIARAAEDAGLTGTGAVIGTWHYMAPERMGGEEIDARSDVYSLACVLYEALTGHRPFPGDSVESQVAAHLTAPPPRPTSANPALPAAFDSVIATGMAKNPDQRYQSTMDLARAAQQAVTAPVPPPPPPPPPPPQRATRVAGPAAAPRYRPPENPTHQAPQGYSPGQPPRVAVSTPPPLYPPPGGGYQSPRGFVAPQGGESPPKAYTLWGWRVLASLIDGLVPFALWLIGVICLVAMQKVETVCVDHTSGYDLGQFCATGNNGPSGAAWATFVILQLVSLLFQIWNYGYKQGRTGSSIGKSSMKFKVVSEATGQPIGVGMSLVRQLAHVIDAAICYIGFLFPLWDAKRQTIADKIVGTVCMPI